MPGPIRKPSSRQSRGVRGSGGTRQLSPVPDVEVPDFPLQPDPRRVAELNTVRDRVANLQGQLAAVEDRRKRYRLKRELDKVQLVEATIALEVEQSADAEREFWRELWTAPQAVYWAENTAAVRELAMYVRWMIRAEYGDTKASGEARALSNALGINPTALLRLRAEIEHTDQVESTGRRRRQREAVQPEQGGNGKDEGGDPRAGLYAV